MKLFILRTMGAGRFAHHFPGIFSVFFVSFAAPGITGKAQGKGTRVPASAATAQKGPPDVAAVATVLGESEEEYSFAFPSSRVPGGPQGWVRL